MESLLDQADALVLTAGEDGPERPDFDIPEEYMLYETPGDKLQILEHPDKGKGFFATRPLPAGTLLLVAKPIAWALDSEWDGGVPDDEIVDMEEDSEHPAEPEESHVNELLVLEALQVIKESPSIWLDQITNLYPRDPVDIQASPVWISKDDDIFAQFEQMIKELETIPALRGKSNEISQRLPLIIRYNVLSVETCPELLGHPGPTGHASLSGVGLYYFPSFFNHDARPNVSRYAVGDIMWFVANQDIPTGSEVCISYLEHDILCENPFRRNNMLTLDFKEHEDPNAPNAMVEGPGIPVVDSDVQNELMAMDPFERLDNIDQLMKQATGEAPPEGEELDEDEMEAGEEVWFECDLQNLRILKAITLDSMGHNRGALELWEQCVQFAETRLPPNDESSVVMHVQAALCAWVIKEEERARQHANVAVQVHNTLFGGGIPRFRRRYQKEFFLNLRDDKSSGGSSTADILWPLRSGEP
eukprot:Nitzschia sp. Nitz4//scaffold55_size114948//92800//94221//NITZ4_003921-RA/size114948-processed-gene-0.52-mRNA-1//1//CDS//3329554590//359//frame0